jgi:hypothetical protein
MYIGLCDLHDWSNEVPKRKINLILNFTSQRLYRKTAGRTILHDLKHRLPVAQFLWISGTFRARIRVLYPLGDPYGQLLLVAQIDTDLRQSGVVAVTELESPGGEPSRTWIMAYSLRYVSYLTTTVSIQSLKQPENPEPHTQSRHF